MDVRMYTNYIYTMDFKYAHAFCNQHATTYQTYPSLSTHKSVRISLKLFLALTHTHTHKHNPRTHPTTHPYNQTPLCPRTTTSRNTRTSTSTSTQRRQTTEAHLQGVVWMVFGCDKTLLRFLRSLCPLGDLGQIFVLGL